MFPKYHDNIVSNINNYTFTMFDLAVHNIREMLYVNISLRFYYAYSNIIV